MRQLPLLPVQTRWLGAVLVTAAVATYLLNGIYNDRTCWFINFPVIAYEEPFGPKEYFSVSRVAFYDTFLCLLFLVGLMCIAFSKTKREDEYINSIRLNAWLWAVLINVSLVCVSFLLFYGMSFFFIIAGNLFSLLIIFILRFHYLLYKTGKEK